MNLPDSCNLHDFLKDHHPKAMPRKVRTYLENLVTDLEVGAGTILDPDLIRGSAGPAQDYLVRRGFQISSGFGQIRVHRPEVPAEALRAVVVAALWGGRVKARCTLPVLKGDNYDPMTMACWLRSEGLTVDILDEGVLQISWGTHPEVPVD